MFKRGQLLLGLALAQLGEHGEVDGPDRAAARPGVLHHPLEFALQREEHLGGVHVAFERLTEDLGLHVHHRVALSGLVVLLVVASQRVDRKPQPSRDHLHARHAREKAHGVAVLLRHLVGRVADPARASAVACARIGLSLHCASSGWASSPILPRLLGHTGAKVHRSWRSPQRVPNRRVAAESQDALEPARTGQIVKFALHRKWRISGKLAINRKLWYNRAAPEGASYSKLFEIVRCSMENAKNSARDYLAIILVGAGSSYARGPDRDDCIERVKRIVVSDWSSLFDLKGKEATVNVVDVTGHEEVWWDDRGVHVDGDPEPSLPIEQVKVVLPNR